MVIHCDYCGGAFDPEENAVCPNCGAPWDKDREAATVHTEESRRAQAEKNAAETQSFLRIASVLSQNARDIGRAAGSVGKVFKTIFAIVLIVFLCLILFAALHIFPLI